MNLSIGTFRECKALFDEYKVLWKINKVVPLPETLREIQSTLDVLWISTLLLRITAFT